MSNHVLVLWAAHEYNTYGSHNGRTNGPDFIEVVSEVLFMSPIYRTCSYAEWSGPNFEHFNTWLSSISCECMWSHCHCSQLETLYPNLGLVFSSPPSCTNLHQPCFQHHHLCFCQHYPFSPPLPFFDPIEVCFIFISIKNGTTQMWENFSYPIWAKNWSAPDLLPTFRLYYKHSGFII